VALVALIFLLPWLGTALLPSLRPLLGRRLGRWALVPPAASFLITLTFVPPTSHGQGVRYTLPWFPALGVNFSLWVDGLEVIVSLLLLVGLVFTFAGSFGLLRLPDIICRMHATGKSSTVGVSAIVLASFTYFTASEPGASIKELLTIVFVFLSGPVGAHMIARAAYRSQVPLHERTIVNEWKAIEEGIGEPHQDA